jgi:hypothetical protein
MCHAPAATPAHAEAGPTDPDEVAAAAALLAGPAMDEPMASFTAHVAAAGQPRRMRFSGVRRVAGDAVAGAPESFPARAGYRLP